MTAPTPMETETRVLWFAVGAVASILAAAIILWPLLRATLGRVEQRTRRAERRARQAEKLAELGAMTSGLAHEIKNPLSTVGLNAQLLAEEIEDAEIATDRRQRILRRVETLEREANRLRNILTDFLRYAGRMKLDTQPVDLAALVEGLVDFLHPQCERSGILLRTDIARRPVVADADEGLLKQAVLNLMLNAIQAMDTEPDREDESPVPRRGELILRVEGDDQEARIHVIDTGPGIPTDRLEEIFQPYVTSKTGGTGLGLPTARRIAEEHGGRLEALSKLNHGCDFVVHVPRHRSPATTAETS